MAELPQMVPLETKEKQGLFSLNENKCIISAAPAKSHSIAALMS